MTRWNLHRWVIVGLVVVFVASVGVWWNSRGRLPREVRIATAEPGGLYHRFAEVFAERFEAQTGRPVAVVPSRGSVQNLELLRNGEVDLAILQATSVPPETLGVIAPLYPEVVHVVAAAGSGIEAVGDLPGHRVSLGPEGSGMHVSALELLAHYRVDTTDLAETKRYFRELATGELDAAIVTTGIDNPDLMRLLAEEEVQLVPILDSGAIAIRRPLFVPYEIPRGLYDEGPPVPPEALETIATVNVMAMRIDGAEVLVHAAMEVLYETELRAEFPQLIPKREALARAPAPLHPAAVSYFEPYAGLGVLSQAIEALSGAKELLFGLGALAVLVVDLVRHRRRKRREAIIREQKDRLDAFLARTVEIERAQMDTRDAAELNRFLDEVTTIKLEALEELTHEDLRGDRMFLIFLTQCANLIRKIQSKILSAEAVR